MKKSVVLVFIIFMGFISAKAQTPSDSVFVHKNFWGYKFYQKDTRLNFNQLPYIMEGDQEAYLLIKKARNINTISSVISGIGGFLLGWQLVTVLVGGEANWTMVAIGGGLIVVSIPIYSKSHKQSLQAVNLYNAGLSASSRRPRIVAGTMQHGIGVRLEF